MKYILCGVYVVFSVLGLTLIKVGGSQEINSHLEIPIVNIAVSIWSFVGIICYAISFLLYLIVISKFNLGFIIPILGGVINIMILIVAYFILKEALTFHMLLGAVIIVIGIVIMNIS
ncbi:hypothetical protein [Thomasclavelia cocleata]|uniref:hypothetical protein n=1 Tax=Thomasclavelia cocleata TaxID=69824 RepID=UPI0025A01F17|nr:hypothetical protein [Thomasclavelia cocleata]MCX4374683.1 hypothetical protein [Lachnospiraceae bacterium]